MENKKNYKENNGNKIFDSNIIKNESWLIRKKDGSKNIFMMW